MFEKANMVVVKLTRDCNLRCKYCYIKNKDNFKNELMDFSVFKRLVDNIVRDKRNTGNNNRISLVLHGGEPTLVPVETLRKFLSYAKRTFEKNKINFSFSMQTNATMLKEEVLLLLHDYDVDVGLSFDGVASSNSLRTDKSTVFYEEVMDKLNQYKIRYGLLMVVSPVNIDNVSENVNYIRNILKLDGFKINYAEDVLSLGGCEVTGKDFFEKVQKVVIEECIEKSIPLRESNLRKIIENYFKNRFFKESIVDNLPGNCLLKVCGGGINIVELNPDGTLNLCGRYSEDFEDVSLGSLFDKDFLSLKSIHTYFNTVKSKHKLLLEAGCDICPADDICDHGCIAFHRSKYGKWGIRKDLVCDIFKPLKSYLTKNEERIFNVLFNSGKKANNIFYFKTNREITKEDIEIISRVIGEKYTVELDLDFKINQEKIEGKTYQVKIKRREDELYNNKEL